MAANTRFLEGELVLPEEGYCANMYQYVPILPHNNFDLRMTVQKALVFLYTLTFFETLNI